MADAVTPPPVTAPAPSPVSITPEIIQKYLDENQALILAILENTNLNQLEQCAPFQSRLQQNLMYLAAIADAQRPVDANASA